MLHFFPRTPSPELYSKPLMTPLEFVSDACLTLAASESFSPYLHGRRIIQESPKEGLSGAVQEVIGAGLVASSVVLEPARFAVGFGSSLAAMTVHAVVSGLTVFPEAWIRGIDEYMVWRGDGN